MSGDVFGNGMLLSKHTRLVAAFDHRHIFLDPNPDAAASFRERERLFKLPRSSWDDYIAQADLARRRRVAAQREVDSAVAPRRASCSDLDVPRPRRSRCMRAILRMRVDLLWNGGIGTYVKAHEESHAEARDRANDAIRADGREVRARVIGEGGNLGCTQRGRVEYAQFGGADKTGGRINTDFIDNSAGVNTSDVEVNIKILLADVARKGRLTRAARDKLLASMTDEVATLVLRNNYLQSQALSVLEQRAAERLTEYQSLIRALERGGHLNRAIEFLPGDDEILERRKQRLGLTRPELAVVLAYSKIWLSNHLLDSDLPDDPYFASEVQRYFPAPMRRRYPREIPRHRLRREIVATATTNSLVNRMGPVFVTRAQEETEADPAAIARAYTIAREIFSMRALWADIEALDNKVPADVQYGMFYRTGRLLRHTSYWLLRERGKDLHIENAVRELKPGRRSARRQHRRRRMGGAAREQHDAALRRARRERRAREARAARRAPVAARAGARHRGAGAQRTRARRRSRARVLRARRRARTRLAARRDRPARGRWLLAGHGAHRPARCRDARASPAHAAGAAHARRAPAANASRAGARSAATRSRAGSARSPRCAPSAPPISPRSPWAWTRCAASPSRREQAHARRARHHDVRAPRCARRGARERRAPARRARRNRHRRRRLGTRRRGELIAAFAAASRCRCGWCRSRTRDSA